MTATEWTDENGTKWVVGARVMWTYGRRDYAEFGAWGEVISVPDGDDERLMVRLQPAPESQKERRDVEKREKAGEDLTRLSDMRGEYGLKTAPQVFRINAERFERIGAQWREDLERYDENGVPREGVTDRMSA